VLRSRLEAELEASQQGAGAGLITYEASGGSEQVAWL
jgi:hypothetical protein